MENAKISYLKIISYAMDIGLGDCITASYDDKSIYKN